MVAKRSKKRKKRSLKNILFYIFFGCSSLLVVGFLIVTNWNIHKKRTELAKKIEVLEVEVKKAEGRNKDLKESAIYVETEDYLEEVARDQLDMRKPGEEVVAIQKEDNNKKEEEEEKKSWWEKLKSLLE